MDTDNTLPALFLSHGSPMLAIEDSPTGRFLDALGPSLPPPRAIVLVSAHYLRKVPTVAAATHPETVHDFGGFPAALYAIRYPAPGDPVLAARVIERLRAAGIPAQLEEHTGLDHGAWVPLRRMYPRADIPVVALSVNPYDSADAHYRIGLALSDLRREGVLVIGSGGFSHNLRSLDWQRPDAPVFNWVERFTGSLRERLEAGDVAGALDWRSLPEASRNHPTPEHLYPLFVALGAGGPDVRARLLHRDVELGGLALDAFAFDSAPAGEIAASASG